MKTIRLQPTGAAPIEFRGRLLAQAGEADELARRWHRLSIYETASGRYVLVVEYHAGSKLERDDCEAVVCDDLAEVADELADWDPCECVVWWPERHSSRNETIRAGVTAQFDSAVSSLLAAAGFVERI